MGCRWRRGVGGGWRECGRDCRGWRRGVRGRWRKRRRGLQRGRRCGCRGRSRGVGGGGRKRQYWRRRWNVRSWRERGRLRPVRRGRWQFVPADDERPPRAFQTGNAGGGHGADGPFVRVLHELLDAHRSGPRIRWSPFDERLSVQINGELIPGRPRHVRPVEQKVQSVDEGKLRAVAGGEQLRRGQQRSLCWRWRNRRPGRGSRNRGSAGVRKHEGRAGRLSAEAVLRSGADAPRDQRVAVVQREAKVHRDAGFAGDHRKPGKIAHADVQFVSRGALDGLPREANGLPNAGKPHDCQVGGFHQNGRIRINARLRGDYGGNRQSRDEKPTNGCR